MRSLLPNRGEPGWVIYIWLVYLIFFFEHPFAEHVGKREWIATIAGVVVFLAFYFGVFWLKRPWNLVCVGAIVALGVIFAPYNLGAACFFIYAAAFIPFVVRH